MASRQSHGCVCSSNRACPWRRRETAPTRQSWAGAHPRDHVQETPLKPVLGERNEDLHEKKSLHQQRSAPQSAQKCVPEKHAALLGENQEDCQNLHDLRLECQRSARLPSPVQREDLVDLHQQHQPEELECRRSARRGRTRCTEYCASSAGWTNNLGHIDNLLGNAEIEICGSTMKSTGTTGTGSTICTTVRR